MNLNKNVCSVFVREFIIPLFSKHIQRYFYALDIPSQRLFNNSSLTKRTLDLFVSIDFC